eukprot:TRINITY_DN6525_c0_g1_i1.p1 TRINITY_DN6525_c0_g1~~TRINITY_DN6525_c0_g1_i1.p1  ORF type:complete len:1631 (-),score=246.78 TRINITY_DN6525_c0_g1_i1:81-4529(-)
MSFVYNGGYVGYPTQPGLHVFNSAIQAAKGVGITLEFWRALEQASELRQCCFASVEDVDNAIRAMVPKFPELTASGLGCNATDVTTCNVAGYLVPYCPENDFSICPQGSPASSGCCQGGWYYSSACVANKSACLPVILGEVEWNFKEWVTTAEQHNLPLAFTSVSGNIAGWFGEIEVVNQLYAQNKSALFYWWTPDNTFADLETTSVIFRDSMLSISQNQVTLKITLSRLNSLNPDWNSTSWLHLERFFNALSLTAGDMEVLMGSFSGTDDSAFQESCNWVKNNTAKWQSWLLDGTYCDLGQYYSQEEKMCVMCRAGTISTQERSTSCEECSMGRFQQNEGRTECLSCLAGSYMNTTGAAVCSACAAGTYSNTGGAVNCTSCSPGYTTTVVGSSSSNDCILPPVVTATATTSTSTMTEIPYIVIVAFALTALVALLLVLVLVRHKARKGWKEPLARVRHLELLTSYVGSESQHGCPCWFDADRVVKGELDPGVLSAGRIPVLCVLTASEVQTAADDRAGSCFSDLLGQLQVYLPAMVRPVEALCKREALDPLQVSFCFVIQGNLIRGSASSQGNLIRGSASSQLRSGVLVDEKRVFPPSYGSDLELIVAAVNVAQHLVLSQVCPSDSVSSSKKTNAAEPAPVTLGAGTKLPGATESEVVPLVENTLHMSHSFSLIMDASSALDHRWEELRAALNPENCPGSAFAVLCALALKQASDIYTIEKHGEARPFRNGGYEERDWERLKPEIIHFWRKLHETVCHKNHAREAILQLWTLALSHGNKSFVECADEPLSAKSGVFNNRHRRLFNPSSDFGWPTSQVIATSDLMHRSYFAVCVPMQGRATGLDGELDRKLAGLAEDCSRSLHKEFRDYNPGSEVNPRLLHQLRIMQVTASRIAVMSFSHLSLRDHAGALLLPNEHPRGLQLRNTLEFTETFLDSWVDESHKCTFSCGPEELASILVAKTLQFFASYYKAVERTAAAQKSLNEIILEHIDSGHEELLSSIAHKFAASDEALEMMRQIQRKAEAMDTPVRKTLSGKLTNPSNALAHLEAALPAFKRLHSYCQGLATRLARQGAVGLSAEGLACFAQCGHRGDRPCFWDIIMASAYSPEFLRSTASFSAARLRTSARCRIACHDGVMLNKVLLHVADCPTLDVLSVKVRFTDDRHSYMQEVVLEVVFKDDPDTFICTISLMLTTLHALWASRELGMRDSFIRLRVSQKILKTVGLAHEIHPAFWCISLGQLKDFCALAEKQLGESYPEAAMWKIVKAVIIPQTVDVRKSYSCKINASKLKSIDIFVSHCWAENFNLFVSLIQEALSLRVRADDVNLWMCSFALNQHDVNVGDDLADAPFARALRKAKEMLVVRNDTADLYTRAWCVYEVFLAKQLGKKIDATGPDLWSSNKVDIMSCTASVKADEIKIKTAIQKAGLVEEVNKIVSDIQATGRRGQAPVAEEESHESLSITEVQEIQVSAGYHVEDSLPEPSEV